LDFLDYEAGRAATFLQPHFELYGAQNVLVYLADFAQEDLLGFGDAEAGNEEG
jgi:hypothetical protein